MKHLTFLILTLCLCSMLTAQEHIANTNNLRQKAEMAAQAAEQAAALADSLAEAAEIADSIATEEALRADSLKLDSIVQDAIEEADSLEQNLLPQYDQTELDQRLIDWTLSFLDTTLCIPTYDTTPTPDSVFRNRLQALPHEIEMPYNATIRRFIELYVVKRKAYLAALLQLGNYYFPIFEDFLARHNMPLEFKYLAVIESGLNPTAHSKAGAAGLWQFMPSTGRMYGLEINSLVDERHDVYKATDAACRYLKALYSIYGDWNLAIASYNCGPGNVNKAIHRSGGKRDFWDIYPYLPAETRSYLPIFIAANYAMNYAGEHGVCVAPAKHVVATDTIKTTRRLHLEQVAKVLDLPKGELRFLNAQYTKDVLPGHGMYSLCLPVEAIGPYFEREDSIFAYKADSLINNRRAEIDLAQKTTSHGYTVNGVTYYKIKKGDNLGSIAKRYHCTVKQIMRWNNMRSDVICAGKTLKICK